MEHYVFCISYLSRNVLCDPVFFVSRFSFFIFSVSPFGDPVSNIHEIDSYSHKHVFF